MRLLLLPLLVWSAGCGRDGLLSFPGCGLPDQILKVRSSETVWTSDRADLKVVVAAQPLSWKQRIAESDLSYEIVLKVRSPGVPGVYQCGGASSDCEVSATLPGLGPNQTMALSGQVSISASAELTAELSQVGPVGTGRPCGEIRLTIENLLVHAREM